MRSFRKKNKAEWRKIIAAWRESGTAVSTFCQQQGVTEGRFYSWRKHFGIGSKIEILLGNGAVVRISGELSDDNLSRVMTLAAGASC